MRRKDRTLFPRLQHRQVVAATLVLSLCPLLARVQERIDPTVGTVGTIANDGPPPAGGRALLPADSLTALSLAGRSASQAQVQALAVTGQPFTRVLRVRVPAGLADDAILLRADVAGPIKSGDTLYVHLYGRIAETTEAGGESSVSLAVNRRGSPGESAFFGGSARFGPEWRRFDLPVPAWRGFPEAEFTFKIGGKSARTIEIADLAVYDFGALVPPHRLPYRRATYAGREPDAPWRRAALARIEKYRKGDLTVSVTDTWGRPLPGTRVAVRMTRHAYRFGTAVNPTLLQSGLQGDRYRDWIKKLFNEAVIENNLKWNDWDRPGDRETALQMVDWLHANGLSVRGHCLVWPGWNNLPERLKQHYTDVKAAQGDTAARAALRKDVDDHITDIVGAMKGKVTDWDVVNETSANHDVLDILGRPVLADWYKRAHEIDPGPTLYLNENSLENGSKVGTFTQDIGVIQQNGGPLGGAGMQGHVGALPIETVTRNLEKIAATGLTIKITEFDMVTPDEQLQADYTRDFLTLVFSEPATRGFLMWGFWDGAHWLGDAPILYKDWTLKPSGQAYMDLVLKQWWTDAKGVTNAKGSLKTRGFLGDYEITVRHGATTKTVPTTLTREGVFVPVKLP